MAADMPELVRTIVQALADQPDAIAVTELDRGRMKVIQLKVSSEDLGRVIGRDGRVANAIRALLDAAPGHDRWKLEIVD